VDDRPADVHDRCVLVAAAGPLPTDSVCLPSELQTRLSTPREVAGGPRTNDILKCRLKPLTSAGHGALGLSDSQLRRLRAVFPKGVCDWSRRGVGQQPVVAWQTYADAKGHVVYGGRPMPAAPRSRS
jgi:hypothetical protein